MSTPLQAGVTVDPYTIRRYESADRDGYRSLYETVYRAEPVDWFEWRYVSSPYLPHVPIFVAETGGDVVGAVAFLPFPVRAGARHVLALQPADAMVHPNHRRQGLFTRILRAAIDHYVDREPSLFFNFPTEDAKPGLAKHGWSALDLATFYRIQNPAAFLRARYGGEFLTAAGLPIRRYLKIRDRFSKVTGLAVERHSDVPAATLASLYEKRVPERIHVPREKQFYEWRFADPNWNPTTYIAVRNGTPVSSAITCSLRLHRRTVCKVMDVLPMVDQERRYEAIGSVLAALVADNPNADVISVSKATLPGAVASAHGFFPDDAPPLSWVTTPTSMVVRPLVPEAEDAWWLGDRCLTDSSDWHLSFSDEDTPL